MYRSYTSKKRDIEIKFDGIGKKDSNKSVELTKGTKIGMWDFGLQVCH